MYTPQITIPGFDDGLVDVFDALLGQDRSDAYRMPGYGGGHETKNGRKPLCGELIAWRHPTFGNYTSKELAYSFVQAHDVHYSRQLFTSFECLTWLLSDNAAWMPQQLRSTLLEGMCASTYGWVGDIRDSKNAFSDALFHRSRSKFRVTRNIRSAVVESFAAALHKLGVQENPDTIAERFLTRGFVSGFYDEQDRWRDARKS